MTRIPRFPGTTPLLGRLRTPLVVNFELSAYCVAFRDTIYLNCDYQWSRWPTKNTICFRRRRYPSLYVWATETVRLWRKVGYVARFRGSSLLSGPYFINLFSLCSIFSHLRLYLMLVSVFTKTNHCGSQFCCNRSALGRFRVSTVLHCVYYLPSWPQIPSHIYAHVNRLPF